MPTWALETLASTRKDAPAADKKILKKNHSSTPYPMNLRLKVYG